MNTAADLFAPALVAVPLAPKPTRHIRAGFECAAEIFRGFAKHERRIVLLKGQLDMADAILAAAAITGPADVIVSAWELDPDSVELLGAARRDGRIKSLFILPETGVRREARNVQAMADAGARVRYAACHAKIATVEAPGWSLAIRGSLNLAKKGRLEQLEIEDSPKICAAWRAYCDTAPERTRKPAGDARALASRALGAMPTGGRAWGITSGYSMIDMVAAALARTGPADVDILAWRIGLGDARELVAMRDAGKIKTLRVLGGQGYFAKELPEAAKHNEIFGEQGVKQAHAHGRFMVIRGADRSVSIHGSGNLNTNIRGEQWDASESPADAAFLSDAFGELWNKTPDGAITPYPPVRDALVALFGQNGTPPPPLRSSSMVNLLSPVTLPEPDPPVDFARYLAADAPLDLAPYRVDAEI